MSESPITQKREKISADQVELYLKSNSEFFSERPELLADLQLPHQSGGATSLVERQVAILRERNMDMRHRLSSLLDNARENDRLFDKTKRLVLAMLECNDLGDLVDALYYSFDKEFNIHYTRLILFGNSSTPASAARIVSVHDARDYIGKRLKLPNTVSGGIDIKETEFLFDDDSANVGSAALAVLQHGSPLGLLAIGNQDPTYYRSSMGTLFLGYIAEVMNRLLPKYLG
jgi:Uncharacterized protein conserved in bacteria